MNTLDFTKMVAAGNDFILLDNRVKGVSFHTTRYKDIAQTLCHRKTGIGADGLLVLENSNVADLRMRIFNADGSEAEMCGNGLRCVARHCGKKGLLKIETLAGIYEALVKGSHVKIKMGQPGDIKISLPISIARRTLRLNFINTGVPHAVVFVEGLDRIDVENLGRSIRYHRKFKPGGTNVDFVEVVDDKNIKMRTYERGVEGETLACGTGAVGSAIISNIVQGTASIVNVHAPGGILKVYFKKENNHIKDVYLEGEVREVFRGRVDI